MENTGLPVADPSDAVLRHIGQLAEEIDHPLFSEVFALLPVPFAEFRDVAPARPPVVDWLDVAFDNAPPRSRSVLGYLKDNRDSLHWGQTYSSDDFGADFLKNYCYTEFAGLRGPVPSERVACGVLFLGPKTDYPAHSHEAEEVYVPLTGTASWWRKGDAWTSRAPLEVIHHKSWVPHAMRTGTQPLIALYLWRGGDLKQKSRID